jgi:hypothetical protein
VRRIHNHLACVPPRKPACGRHNRWYGQEETQRLNTCHTSVTPVCRASCFHVNCSAQNWKGWSGSTISGGSRERRRHCQEPRAQQQSRIQPIRAEALGWDSLTAWSITTCTIVRLDPPRYRGNDPCPKLTTLENSRGTKLGTQLATYGEFAQPKDDTTKQVT